MDSLIVAADDAKMYRCADAFTQKYTWSEIHDLYHLLNSATEFARELEYCSDEDVAAVVVPA